MNAYKSKISKRFAETGVDTAFTQEAYDSLTGGLDFHMPLLLRGDRANEVICGIVQALGLSEVSIDGSIDNKTLLLSEIELKTASLEQDPSNPNKEILVVRNIHCTSGDVQLQLFDLLAKMDGIRIALTTADSRSVLEEDTENYFANRTIHLQGNNETQNPKFIIDEPISSQEVLKKYTIWLFNVLKETGYRFASKSTVAEVLGITRSTLDRHLGMWSISETYKAGKKKR